MSIRVLALATSPRRHGNSETLLDGMLKAMEQHGADVTKHALTELKILPCRGCNSCEKNGECVIKKDDTKNILDEMIAADIVIFAAPIFCMGIPSQAKALVDRMQVLRSRKFVLEMPIVPKERKGKRIGVFLSTAGQDWDWVFDSTIPTIECFFGLQDIKKKEIRYLMINNIDKKGEILKHPTACNEAKLIARQIMGDIQALQEVE